MTILKAARRIFSLALAICLLAGVLPSLVLADSTWKNRETPYGAKLKAGTVLYADEEMEQEAWLLKEDALVRVTETRPKTAKVEFTVKKQPKTAWVDGELLQPVDLATPTDLDAVIVSQDVILSEVEESNNEQVPTDNQPEEAPIEAEPEQGDPSTRPDGLGQDDNLAGEEPAEPEETNTAVISSEVEKSPSEAEPEQGDLSTTLRSGRDDKEEGSEPTEPQETNTAVISSEVEKSPSEAEPEQGDLSTTLRSGRDDKEAGSEPAQPEEANTAVISSEVEKSPSESVSTEPEPEESNPDCHSEVRSARETVQWTVSSEERAAAPSNVEESNNEQVPTDAQPEETPTEITEEIPEPTEAPAEPEETPEEDIETITLAEAALPEEAPPAPEDLSGTTALFVAEDGSLTAASFASELPLPEIRNQNPFNTCWAFSAIGGMEIDLIRDGKATSSLDLSEFFLAYFSSHNFPFPKGDGGGDSVTYTGDDSPLMNGGNTHLAYSILANLIGTTLEEDNPYPGKEEGDRQADADKAIAAQLTGAYNISSADVDLLKEQIQAHGSARASIYMPRQENYGKRVKVKDGMVGYNPSTGGYYGTYSGTNHDVLLVGWDDSYSTDNFLSGLRPEKPGAWKARNSWGTSFGEGGYFWISYEDAALRATGATVFDAENTNISDYCYSNSKTLGPGKNVLVPDKAVVSQFFPVDGQETLQYVGVETTSDNLTLSGRILVNGEEVASTEPVTARYNGFYLLKLNTPYLVATGTRVEVEVTMKANTEGSDVLVFYQYAGEKDFASSHLHMTAGVDENRFTINKQKIDGDSTLRLYTKKASSSGLVTRITLDRTSVTGMKTGDAVQLMATITPADASNPTLRWYSSDLKVAWLDGDGKVVGGDRSGTAVITVMSSNGVSASCTVENNHMDLPLKSVKIKGYTDHTFRIDDESGAGIRLGDRLKLEAELTPQYTAQNGLKWKSSDESVISIVSAEGSNCEIRILKNGTATVTVTSTADESKTDWVDFTVFLVDHVTSVSLNKSMISLWEGETFQLEAAVIPETADNRNVTWTTGNEKVAAVTGNGLVTAGKDGNTVITVTTEDGGYTAPCVVVVASRDLVEQFVYRMYRICLLREPDEGGFSGWTEALRSGAATGSQLAYGFLNSDEMIGRNLSDGDFVERNYEAIMGRASDAGGKQGWVDALAAGMSRKAVISGFLKSQEFSDICDIYGIEKGDYTSDEPRDVNAGVTGFVSRLYTKMLGRAYDPDGLNAWSAAILKAPTAATVLQVSLNGFMHSPEFVNKNLNDTELVKVLYRTFLDREADQGGLSAWVQALQQGNDRDTVAAGFANSPEFANIMAKYGF